MLPNHSEFLKYKEEVERDVHSIWFPHSGQIEIAKLLLIDWALGVFLQCGRKFGKQNCLETPILTPDRGFIRYGDLVEGDLVYDEKGKTQTVLQVHPVNVTPEGYRVHFCNGTYIDACKDHRWLTWTKADRKNERRGLSFNPSVKTTEEIFNTQMAGKEYNHSIPYAEPIEMEERELPIDPYVLGSWLGDGCTNDSRFSSADEEILDEIREHYDITKLSGDNCDYYIRGLGVELRELGVLGNKHIPNEYLMSSKEQRLSILQGLMDTDGTINKSGNSCEFYTVLPELADQVDFLVCSLGMKATRRVKKSYIGNKRYKDCYCVLFKPICNVFRLSRKKDRININATKRNHHTIKKVERIESKPMRCITVSGESSLYLLGKSLIPTHNTELAVYLLYMFAMLFENAECYFIADEKDHARDIVWNNGRLPRFFTSFRQNKGESYADFKARKILGEQLENKWIASVNNSEMIVKFKNNSFIAVEGAKNYAKADGLTPTFVVYDEFKHHDRRYDTAMRPNLRALNGRILIMGTPPDNEENYYCETVDEFRHRDKHYWVKRPSYMNPHVYDGKDDPFLKEEEKAYRRKNEYHVFAREYLAEIYPDHNSMIFPMLDPEKHVDKYEDMVAIVKKNYRDWDLFVSFDPAASSVFGVLLVAINNKDKRVWLLDEVYEDKTMETRAKNIFNRAREKWREVNAFDADWHKIYDYAEKWFQVEIAHEFDEAIFPCEKDLKNKEAKLSIIKDTMLYGRFKASDRCTKTFWELQLYKKDENGKIPKENDHNIDNLRYILNAASYDSVPREELIIIDERRAFSVEDDLSEDLDAERLMGGILDDDGFYDGGY